MKIDDFDGYRNYCNHDHKTLLDMKIHLQLLAFYFFTSQMSSSRLSSMSMKSKYIGKQNINAKIKIGPQIGADNMSMKIRKYFNTSRMSSSSLSFILFNLFLDIHFRKPSARYQSANLYDRQKSNVCL